jgi:Holliday junction resolvasome RuvABC DNA-binding subunit
MLDRLNAVHPEPTDTGIAVQLGRWQLVFATSTHDRTLLCDSDECDIYCELEFDLNSGTLHALAFADEKRRSLYRALRSVPGIGRTSAFAVLDAGEVIDTLRAVAANDGNYFRQVPGLGPKKIAAVIASLGKRYKGSLPRSIPAPVALLVEAREALIQQGFSEGKAEELLLGVADDKIKSAEEWLGRLAL